MDDLHDAIRAAGLKPPEHIEPGRICRFPGAGKSNGNTAGWCLLFPDGDGAVYGDWSTGLEQTWQARRSKPMTEAERQEWQRKIREAQQQAEAERQRQHAEAAKRAAEIWQQARPATDNHPYLTAKGVQAHGLRIHDGALVIPLRDASGEIHSLQFIAPDGHKRFLAGGRVAGCYLPIGAPDGVIAVCEGYATGASIYAATGYAVAVAFNAGNLKPVTEALRAKFPDARFVLCADNDRSGVGEDKARQAAKAVNGMVALPPERGDWNDCEQAHGAGAVRQGIESAINRPPPDVICRRMSEIQARPVKWLWPGRIPKGKCTLIAGDPKLGKSQITASMASIVSTGGLWPMDRTRAGAGDIVFLSAEDDAADTIKPRLMAAGADMDRVWILETIIEDDAARPFILSRDIQRLADQIRYIGRVALVVIDPISAYLGSIDSHKNADVRAALAPLGKLAADCGAAFVCVSHFNKAGVGSALHRVTGSLAFTAAARSTYIVSKDPDDESRNLFLPSGNNLAPDMHGLAFHIESASVEGIDTSRVSWHAEPVTITADQAMVTVPDEEHSTRSECGEWLRSLLDDMGALSKREVMSLGKREGFSERTIHRARTDLRLLVKTQGFGKEKQSWWSLPNHANPGTSPTGTNEDDSETRATQGFQADDPDHSCQPCQDTETGTVGTDREAF